MYRGAAMVCAGALSALVGVHSPRAVHGQGALPQSAQQVAAATGTLLGMVTDAEGDPLAEVIVEIFNVEDGVLTRLRTGDDGRYRVSGAPPGGPYRFLVHLEGYLDMRDSVILDAGATVRRNFQLVADPTFKVAARSRAATLRLDAKEISRSEASTALDAIRKLRPNLLSPDMQGCMRGDSLALYVNGMRRPTVDPMPSNEEQARMQQDSIATARAGRVGAALAWMDSAPAQSGRQDRRKQRLGIRTSTDYAMMELDQLPAMEVASIRYSGCAPSDPEIRLRNVIWVELKGWKER